MSENKQQREFYPSERGHRRKEPLVMTLRANIYSLTRFLRSAHGAVVAVLLLLAILLGLGLRSLSTSKGNKPSAQTSSESATAEIELPVPAVPRYGSGLFVTRFVDPHTEAANGRLDVITYTVQAGDFLFSIAEEFGIKAETILWSNYDVLKDNPELIQPGQVLFILPVDGVYYLWKAGDRLDTVAAQFGVAPEDIILWPGNDLSPTIDVQNPNIPDGFRLVVPGGHREFKQWEPVVLRDNSQWTVGGEGACRGTYGGPVGTLMWVWPTASHHVCGYEYTAYHHGIDLEIGMDEPIHAADRGVVLYAGWNTWGYGNLVVIDHGNGWQTVYAHLDYGGVLVFCGSIVERNQTIGYGGSTGNSTGPHLHFEMIYHGVRINPHDYLPYP
jgi:murein DD-endopeptidase MepM/ murein hydrolase activator NlpD